MSELMFVPIPKESVSDESVLLVQWLVADGTRVQRGAIVAVIETSKSAIDVVAPADGFLHHLKREGESVAVGANFAAISDDPAAPTANPADMSAVIAEPEGRKFDAHFSRAAQLLVRENGLNSQVFAHLALVRREDVEAHLQKICNEGKTLQRDLPQPQNTDILIWGGGGHAKVCVEIIRAVGAHTIYGIVDAKLLVGDSVLGVPVVGHESALAELRNHGVQNAVLGIGAVMAHAGRSILIQRLRKAGYELPNIIHPRASIDPSAKLGMGNVIFAHATVSADVVIGDGCILNSGSVVSHDCRLGNNVHLAPGALLAGLVKVGDDTLIGMAATVFLNSTIGRGVRINNGAVVDCDVPDNAVVRR